MSPADKRLDWRHLLIAVWSLVVMSADLKIVLNRRVHWVVSAMTLLPIVLIYRRELISWCKGHLSTLYPVIFYCGAVFLTGFWSGQPAYDISQAAKVFLILIIMVPVLSLSRALSDAAFRGINAAVVLNTVLMVLGILGVDSVARFMTAVRWGTVLNFPGSLSRLGILPLVYAMYGTFAGEKLSWRHLGLLGASLFLVFMDGSRTAVLGVIIGIMFLAVVFLWEKHTVKIVKTLTVILPLILIMSLVAPSSQRIVKMVRAWGSANQSQSQTAVAKEAPKPGPEVPASRGPVPTDQTRPSERAIKTMQRVDDTRMGMIKTGARAVADHPFLGTGMGSTKHLTSEGPMVVHMSYLQIWADAGLLGFVGFCWIVFGWITLLPRLVQVIPVKTLDERAQVYGAIFMLLYFAWTALFHPVSSEWSEWATYGIPLSMLIHSLTRGQPSQVNNLA